MSTVTLEHRSGMRAINDIQEPVIFKMTDKYNGAFGSSITLVMEVDGQLTNTAIVLADNGNWRLETEVSL